MSLKRQNEENTTENTENAKKQKTEEYVVSDISVEHFDILITRINKRITQPKQYK